MFLGSALLDPRQMLGGKECRRRAAELERLAKGAKDPALRAELLKVAEGWRDLARRDDKTGRRDEDA